MVTLLPFVGDDANAGSRAGTDVADPQAGDQTAAPAKQRGGWLSLFRDSFGSNKFSRTDSREFNEAPDLEPITESVNGSSVRSQSVAGAKSRSRERKPAAGGLFGRRQQAESVKLAPGDTLPHVVLGTVQGGRVEVGAPQAAWTLVAVYGGRYSGTAVPLLSGLAEIAPEMHNSGVEVVALSGDSLPKAESVAFAVQESIGRGMSFPVLYNLPQEVAEEWGLYLAQPEDAVERHPYTAPALFLLDQDGLIQAVHYASAGFILPDMTALLAGIKRLVAKAQQPTF